MSKLLSNFVDVSNVCLIGIKEITRFAFCPTKIREMVKWSDSCRHPGGKCLQNIPHMLPKQDESGLVFFTSALVEVTLRLSQSANMSWYRVPLWDLRPDIISCRNVAVWNLRSCIYGAPSLTRGRVCNLQCNHSMVRVAQNPKPYFTVSSETPPTWKARFLYLYPPGTGWPSYTPGHWVPFRSSFTTRRVMVEVF
jgi:hypothetical protein